MTERVAVRAWVAVGSLIAFFVLLTSVAADPFPGRQSPSSSQAATALAGTPGERSVAARERALEQRRRRVQRLVERRWATYRVQRARRLHLIARLRARERAAAARVSAARSAAARAQATRAVTSSSAPSTGGHWSAPVVPQASVAPATAAVTSSSSS